ncbi:alpha-amylase [Corynebacterium diphtheriae subsp. lausannense]|nr:alpha-amylase [Corynebacterium diphtheriae subsp. lausannense]
MDPRLGTAEDWQSLVAACDERGIAVIFDGVSSHVADVMRYWLDQGATGVASRRSLFRRLGILARGAPPSPHHPPPRLHFDEVIHGDYAQIIADTSMDSVTQYELWKAIWPSLKDENFFELDWCIKRHNVSTGLALPSISPRNTKADHRGRRNAQEHRIRQHQP